MIKVDELSNGTCVLTATCVRGRALLKSRAGLSALDGAAYVDDRYAATKIAVAARARRIRVVLNNGPFPVT